MISTLLIAGGVAGSLSALTIAIAVAFRRVVPTNMVHIVQSSNATTSYGRSRKAGNTYYEWPASIPKFGVSVIQFPESIFEIKLEDYEAYDQARLPFMVDVTAFFRIEESETAAQRVASFRELQSQLLQVLQGSVRRILATNTLETIMESRSDLGEQFTAEVQSQIKEWGVTTIKTIEFMDLRDSKGQESKVIQNIMSKEQSRISMESRVAVAQNAKTAQLVEIDAERTVKVQAQDALQQVGVREAEKDKVLGLTRENVSQEIQEQAKVTAERTMATQRVTDTAAAEIAKQVSITVAEANKATIILEAEAELEKTKRKAEGIIAEGDASAQAQQKMLMAPVEAQISLAREIGQNPEYQHYLLSLRKYEATQQVGEQMAQALANADLKIISSGGGDNNMLGNITNLADMFTAKGGTNLSSMITALAQTEDGKKLVDGVISKLNG